MDVPIDCFSFPVCRAGSNFTKVEGGVGKIEESSWKETIHEGQCTFGLALVLLRQVSNFDFKFLSLPDQRAQMRNGEPEAGSGA